VAQNPIDIFGVATKDVAFSSSTHNGTLIIITGTVLFFTTVFPWSLLDAALLLAVIMDGDPAVEPELDSFSLTLPLPYRVAIIVVLGKLCSAVRHKFFCILT
jgi:hypothetical protein